MKEIHVQPVMNGFIVTVGCAKVVFNDIHTLCAELKRYHSNPIAVETEYQKTAIYKSLEQIGLANFPEPNRIDSIRVGMPYTATEMAPMSVPGTRR